VAEHFDPGWQAEVDGRQARLAHVDLAALGVKLPAGPHRVELHFWPVGLTRGLWIFGLTLMGFGLIPVIGQALKRVRSDKICQRSDTPGNPAAHPQT